jgi:hypothetical protein
VDQPNDKLKDRIELIKTVNQLEPNGQTSLRSLRERVRLLREVGSQTGIQDESIEALQDEAVEGLAEARSKILEQVHQRAAN